MKERTLAALAELNSKAWFSNVGKATSDNVISVQSWEAAVAASQDYGWRDLREEAANQYRSRLAERDPSCLRRWNEVVVDVRPACEQLVETKTLYVVETNQLPISFVKAVRWDILHLCMESEFADIFPPGFYASQAFWYVEGRFPCGWEGKFPAGKLVVY